MHLIPFTHPDLSLGAEQRTKSLLLAKWGSRQPEDFPNPRHPFGWTTPGCYSHATLLRCDRTDEALGSDQKGHTATCQGSAPGLDLAMHIR